MWLGAADCTLDREDSDTEAEAEVEEAEAEIEMDADDILVGGNTGGLSLVCVFAGFNLEALVLVGG